MCAYLVNDIRVVPTDFPFSSAVAYVMHNALKLCCHIQRITTYSCTQRSL